jgi:hypothetical protein
MLCLKRVRYVMRVHRKKLWLFDANAAPTHVVVLTTSGTLSKGKWPSSRIWRKIYCKPLSRELSS